MTAIILSIGDELVLGQTVDTNSAWLSRQLASIGCSVLAHITVADDQAAIEQAIYDAAGRCDLLLITGGLGPTPDDLTRQALAAVMGTELELNESWLAKLQDFFRQRGREMSETNKVQAMVPRGAKMIDNTCGTAPGLYAVLKGLGGEGARRRIGESANRRIGEGVGSASADASAPPIENRKSKIENPPDAPACEVFVMPGVPKEMFAMFTRDVLPAIRARSGGGVILSRTLHTFGLGESAVAEMLGNLMDRSRNPSVGTTVSNGIVSLRLNARFNDPAEAQRQLDQTEFLCRKALGDLVFGSDDETLPQAIARLLTQDSGLSTQHFTVTTAESCTAGLLAKMLTDIPGSSAYFKRGWITYANEAKIELLGVRPETLAEHGAVSEPTVCEMAAGALQRANATHALAISGIAGPDGGTPAKPVGTVCIALAFELKNQKSRTENVISRTFHLFGDREMIRDRAAKMALTMLRFHLLDKPLPF